VGEKVEAKFRSGRDRGFQSYYPGTITRVRANGTIFTYDVSYEDGDRDVGLKDDVIRYPKNRLVENITGRSSSSSEYVNVEDIPILSEGVDADVEGALLGDGGLLELSTDPLLDLGGVADVVAVDKDREVKPLDAPTATPATTSAVATTKDDRDKKKVQELDADIGSQEEEIHGGIQHCPLSIRAILEWRMHHEQMLGIRRPASDCDQNEGDGKRLKTTCGSSSGCSSSSSSVTVAARGAVNTTATSANTTATNDPPNDNKNNHDQKKETSAIALTATSSKPGNSTKLGNESDLNNNTKPDTKAKPDNNAEPAGLLTTASLQGVAATTTMLKSGVFGVGAKKVKKEEHIINLFASGSGVDSNHAINVDLSDDDGKFDDAEEDDEDNPLLKHMRSLDSQDNTNHTTKTLKMTRTTDTSQMDVEDETDMMGTAAQFTKSTNKSGNESSPIIPARPSSQSSPASSSPSTENSDHTSDAEQSVEQIPTISSSTSSFGITATKNRNYCIPPRTTTTAHFTTTTPILSSAPTPGIYYPRHIPTSYLQPTTSAPIYPQSTTNSILNSHLRTNQNPYKPTPTSSHANPQLMQFYPPNINSHNPYSAAAAPSSAAAAAMDPLMFPNNNNNTNIDMANAMMYDYMLDSTLMAHRAQQVQAAAAVQREREHRAALFAAATLGVGGVREVSAAYERSRVINAAAMGLGVATAIGGAAGIEFGRGGVYTARPSSSPPIGRGQYKCDNRPMSADARLSSATPKSSKHCKSKTASSAQMPKGATVIGKSRDVEETHPPTRKRKAASNSSSKVTTDATKQLNLDSAKGKHDCSDGAGCNNDLSSKKEHATNHETKDLLPPSKKPKENIQQRAHSSVNPSNTNNTMNKKEPLSSQIPLISRTSPSLPHTNTLLPSKNESTINTKTPPTSTTTTASAMKTSSPSNSSGLVFFPTNPPTNLTSQQSNQILNGCFHQFLSGILHSQNQQSSSSSEQTETNITSGVSYLFSLGGAVPFPKTLLSNAVKERIAQAQRSGGATATTVSSIPKEAISATISVWLWSGHSDCFQRAFRKNGRIDVDLECKWLVKKTVDVSVEAVLGAVGGNAANRGDASFVDFQGNAAAKVAALVCEALGKTISINDDVDTTLPNLDHLVHILESQREIAFRLMIQERALLANILARNVTMTKSFADAYVGSMIVAGEAIGHEEVCEIVQDDECGVWTMLPYDVIVSDYDNHGGTWVDPCRRNGGYTPGLTAIQLTRRAHARAQLHRSLHKLQEKYGFQGGTPNAGPYDDSAISPNSSAMISPGVSTPRLSGGAIKRKSSFSGREIDATGGASHAGALRYPAHYCAPLVIDDTDINFSPYGRHQRVRFGSKGRSKRVRTSTSAALANVKDDSASNSTAGGRNALVRSSEPIDWADVAKLFQPVALPEQANAPSPKPVGEVINIFAPVVRNLKDGTDEKMLQSDDDNGDDDGEDEDISEEAVLARHQAVLDHMKEKLDVAFEGQRRR